MHRVTARVFLKIHTVSHIDLSGLHTLRFTYTSYIERRKGTNAVRSLLISINNRFARK